jgi:DNA-directed RNA polymerase subunit RPC12/RpoP
MLPMDKMHTIEGTEQMICYQCKTAMQMQKDSSEEELEEEEVPRRPGLFSRIFRWKQGPEEDLEEEIGVIETRPQESELPKPNPAEPKVVNQERVKFICKDCRYKFSFKRSSSYRLRCPYCGKNNIAYDKTTAESLLKEVDSMDY